MQVFNADKAKFLVDLLTTHPHECEKDLVASRFRIWSCSLICLQNCVYGLSRTSGMLSTRGVHAPI